MLDKLRLMWYKYFDANIPLYYDQIVSNYNSYYLALNGELKEKFLHRIYFSSKFIEFKPVDFEEVSEEMKIIITSALIQITFGLDNYILNKFSTLYVVPTIYYNFGSYKNLLGHVDFDEKCIVISWPSVQEGFIIPDDATNVALHELAHAIQEENRIRTMGNKFFSTYKMETWEKEGVKKLAVIQAEKNTFLKNYGGKNMLELFAVSIEAFFERPVDFKEKLPKLFKKLSVLLNQDPTRGENPILEKSGKVI